MKMSINEDGSTLDFNEICRLCLKKDTNLSTIFTAPLSLTIRIKSLTSLEMFEGDGLPDSVCQQCTKQVELAYQFKTLCKKSDATLRQCLTSLSLHQNDVDYEQSADKHQEKEEIKCTYSTIISRQDQPSTSQEEAMPTVYANCGYVSHIASGAVLMLNGTRNECIELKTTTSSNINATKHKKLQPKSLVKPKSLEVLESKQDPSFEEQSFICKICSKSFLKRENLKKHEIVHSPGNKPFLCHECGKSFLRMQDLNVHMRYHSGDRPYQCSICKSNFHNYSGLKGHENRHYGIKPFLCNICGKNFVQKSQLVNHERTHTQEKPFRCTMCSKAFNTLTNLRTHQKRHSGVNEFCCKICSKAFFTRSGLERHELLHTGHKPHSCQICSLSFFTKSEITRHMRYHKGEKRFECSVCKQKFIENQHLIIHKRIHTGERPYCCELCKKSFYTKSKLNRHMKTHSLHPL